MVKMAAIFLNGKYLGTHEKPKKFLDDFKELRRKGKIDPEVSIAYYEDLDDVQINSDSGRVRRPVIVVENGKSRLTKEIVKKVEKKDMSWDDLFKNGILESLDAEEEENAFIALNEEELTKEHTHLEIDPILIFGVGTGIIPYLEHNQASRNNLGANMCKQAIGMYASNYRVRPDTQKHLLHYPQMPLVNTKTAELIKYNERPSGQNLVVAILSYEGYNMQDAIIVNKSSVERGAFRSTFYRTYTTEEIRYPGGQVDQIHLPTEEVSGYRTAHAYRYLDSDGIVNTECDVDADDVLIGKTSPPRFLESLEEFGTAVSKRRETSETIKHGEKGIVDLVVLTETEEGNKLVKIKVRDLRQAEIGDKIASRHGQKGVIGLLVPQEDMPFTAEGTFPDVIINPHAIPSRMTVGQLLEMIGGKAAALKGETVDGTAFSGSDEAEIRRSLEKLGFKNNGKEVMYDGQSGRMFAVDVFIGIAYYQKLKHMVTDKIRARSRGPVQVLTRQPTEGKAREGGLRLGEMEKDCLVAHGTALLLRERLLEESDKTEVPICTTCGMTAVHDKYRDVSYCPLDGEDVEVRIVEMAYAFKLLLDELKSMLIYPRLVMEE